MPVGNAAPDANKVFNFGIEVDGFEDMFLIQEVKKPKISLGQVKHGGTNYDVKTPGGYNAENATLKSIKAPDGTDATSAIDWLLTCQNPFTGTGQPADLAKRDITFYELDSLDNPTAVAVWEGCFPLDVDQGEYKRGKQDENVIETLILSVDRVRPV